MHKIGILLFVIDIGFIFGLLYSSIKEREDIYSPKNLKLDDPFSCSTLYLSAFTLAIFFMIDGLLYLTALLLEQIWEQYKARLILWSMYFELFSRKVRLFLCAWGGEIYLLYKTENCKTSIILI